MALRYLTQATAATRVGYGETITLPGEVRVTFLPAGHVLGSAQILLEHAGERVIVTGDYKRRKSGVAMRFPRISRIRRDKPAHEPDRIETLRALIQD